MGAESRPAGGAGKRGASSRKRLEEIAGFVQSPAGGRLERLVYERIRLGIMSALVVNDRLSFSALRDLLGTSDGNLSVHARKLEDAGYLSCRKRFEGRRPRTEFRLTRKGREALERYLGHMEALIQATRD